jgi:hypothetical protein
VCYPVILNDLQLYRHPLVELFCVMLLSIFFVVGVTAGRCCKAVICVDGLF